jgi:hypothetical protein
MADTRPVRRPKTHGEGLQTLAQCGIGDCTFHWQADDDEDAMRVVLEHMDRDHPRARVDPAPPPLTGPRHRCTGACKHLYHPGDR